ncbi:MAG: 4-hydroxy-tetrahydrodipicolinate synthase [Holosporales bacterium]|jgi:4-hydroxy-tetrahydrodipicolinate synthase|nr:4-hydroxy-tetrahydrodipicolinate synthase [Holosporales bacterium]
MFKGSIVALVTPFRSGKLDLDSLEKLVNWHIESGTDGIVVCGSTGEGMLLSDDERISVISTAVDVAAKKIPVIAGCSTCCTAEAVRQVTQSERLMADGALVVAPYYVKPTQSGIIEHFKVVMESCSLPIIVYNNPGRCSVGIEVDTIVEIAKFGQIALKDSDTDLARITRLKSIIPHVSMLSGDDATLIGYLAHGGDGCISVTANVKPTRVKQLVTAWKMMDISAAHKINSELSHMNEALFIESNPIPVKYILSQMGMIQNELRSPLLPASLSAIQKINAATRRIKN